MQIQELSELIKKRRSIFPSMYNNTPIHKETIVQILENANWAPNHKKTEPWRFKVFQDDKLISLGQYLGDYYLNNTTEERYSAMKEKKTRQKPSLSGAVIAICMYDDPSVNIPEWEQVAAVACAVQNIWLSCTAMGIGGYWSSPKSILEARDFLKLKDHESCLGLFYMGYTDVEEMDSSRGDINDKIEWV